MSKKSFPCWIRGNFVKKSSPNSKETIGIVFFTGFCDDAIVLWFVTREDGKTRFEFSPPDDSTNPLDPEDLQNMELRISPTQIQKLLGVTLPRTVEIRFGVRMADEDDRDTL